MTRTRKQRGVTLIEIAIVLVIIGLLLGGVLKGQELINNAKVRKLADQNGAMLAAFYAFQDRYRGLPGDHLDITAIVPNSVAAPVATLGNGIIEQTESVYALSHLTLAGFLRCPACRVDVAAIPAGVAPNALNGSSDNTLVNDYGGVQALFHTNLGYANRGVAAGDRGNRLQFFTGPRIPSTILRDVDNKLDDGRANTGDFRFSTYDPSAGAAAIIDVGPAASPVFGTCMETLTGALATDIVSRNWRLASDTPPSDPNCGGSYFL